MNERAWAAKVLEVSSEASDAEIRKAYLKKAWRWHPDVNPNVKEAAQNFIKIQQAYEILIGKKARNFSSATPQAKYRTSGRPDKTMLLRHLRVQKRKQRAEAILASRVRLMSGVWGPFLKFLYILSVFIWLFMPVAFGAALYLSWGFPFADRLAVGLFSLLLWLIPGFFLLQFLVHMRFIWSFRRP